MKSLTWIGAGAVSVLLAGAASAQTLGIGTSPQGSLAYGLGSAVASVATQKGNTKMIVQPYGGSSSFVPLLNNGRIDFGINNIIETSFAVKGTSTFEGHPNPNIQVASVLITSYVGALVRTDSGIKSMADIKGKRISWGYASQTIVQVMLEGILANGGVDPGSLQKSMVPNIVRAAEDLAAGKIDVSFHALGTASVNQINVTTGGVRYLSLNPDPAAEKKMSDLVPGTYVGAVGPSKRNTGIVEKTNLMAYPFLLTVNKNVPDEKVFAVLKAMHENKKMLAASHGALNRFDPAAMASAKGPVSYHAGAIKFYKSAGIWKGN